MTDQETIACQLVAETVRATGSVDLRAVGSSMLPQIWPGDQLHIERRAAAEVRPGEILAFTCYGRLVIHRMLGRDAQGVLTAKGDAVPQADPLVQEQAVLGVVAYAIRNGKRIEFTKTPGPLSRLVAGIVSRSGLASKALQRCYSFRTEVTP